MTSNISRCPHVATIGLISKEDYLNAIQSEKCEKCLCSGPHLWLCLREGCLFVGCGSGKEKNNHSSDHEIEKAHPLQFNLTTKRIWCYVCSQEVLLNNDPPFELSFMDHSIVPTKLINNINQSINNSAQVNLVSLIEENSLNQIKIRHNQYDKCFESTLFELEHSDTNHFIRGDAQEFLRCFMDELHSEMGITISAIQPIDLFSIANLQNINNRVPSAPPSRTITEQNLITKTEEVQSLKDEIEKLKTELEDKDKIINDLKEEL